MKTPVPVIPAPLATPRPEPVKPPVPKQPSVQPAPAVAAKPAAAGAGLKLTLVAAGVVGAAVLGWVVFRERPTEIVAEEAPKVAIQQEQARPVVQEPVREMPVAALAKVQTSSVVPATRPGPPQAKIELPAAAVQAEAKPAPTQPAQMIPTVSSPVTTSSAPVPATPAPAVQARPAEPQTSAAEVARTVPRLLRQVQPDYTPEARRAGIEGMVGLTVQINEEGVPVRAGVARSLDAGLDRKAIEAVAQWRFAPATVDGRAVAATVNVEVRFQLVGAPGRGRPTLKK
jgi:protein TonB